MAIELTTGTLEFAIKLSDGSVVDWQTDLVELKLISESFEGQHALQSVVDEDGNKFLVPTAEFLRDLAKAYSEMGCPVENVTAAKTVWHVVNARFNNYFTDIQTQVTKAIEE